jgi:hypothetical protein
MRHRRLAIVITCLATLASGGCGKQESASGAGSSAASKNVPKVVEEKVPPYAYAAPVKGHVKEVNIGEFDLVDGIAYPSSTGAGTVVFVASRPIASPMLVDSACPLWQARSMSTLRKAKYAEVTLDASGRSRYFAAGTPSEGSLTDLSPRAWTSTLKTDAGKVAGNVVHRRYGRFEFDLPLSHPSVDERSYGDIQKERKLAATTPKPSEKAVIAAYVALRDAVHRKDLKATLSAMGFDAKQVAAIRGMDGIDTDFGVFTHRFLAPGTPGEPWTSSGSGQVRGEGTRANGSKKYFNDYYFDLCGDRLVLTGLSEQDP